METPLPAATALVLVGHGAVAKDCPRELVRQLKALEGGRQTTGAPPTPEEKALEERIREAQKMTALGELVSTTTHEFNNVLTTILNYAKMGLRHQDDATRTKSFEKILAAAERANKITNAVLGVARNRSTGQDATDLAKVVEDSLVLLEREMNKYRIKVEKQYGDVPEAYVNGNQIQQVLLNLMINARQAMPNGGRLLIKISYDQAADTVQINSARINSKTLAIAAAGTISS